LPYNIGNLGFPNPTFTVSSLSPCIGASITLTASHPDPAATFTWSGPGINAGNQSSNPLNITTTSSGTSAYQVTAAIPGCNATSVLQNVIVNPLPSIDVFADGGDSTICLNGAANLSVNGGNSYQWSGPNGYTNTGNSVNVSPFTAINSGYYFVIGTDGNGCVNNDSIEVTSISLPVIDAVASNANGVYCDGSTATLSVSGATNYVWSGPNNFTSNVANPSLFALTSINTGWYFVVGTDANNCSASDSISVSLAQNMNAVAASSDSVICPGEDVLFTASGGDSYIWTGPAGLNTQQPSFTVYSVTPANTGWYYLTSLDMNGCVAGDSTFLSVEPNAGCLYIPNLFTPDFDTHNDQWVIEGLENFENAEVEVYNRWGNLVYKVSPYKNDWDGTVNEGATIGSTGKVPVGTYFYIIRLNDEEGTPAFKGYVEIQY
jgi:gliding motility-associated-like protein